MRLLPTWRCFELHAWPIATPVSEAAGQGTKMADHFSPIFRPALPPSALLAVKGSLRRVQQRRALDRSGPFRTTLLRRGKGSLRTAPLAGDHFAAILVPFFAATDTSGQATDLELQRMFTLTN